jgi:hypothetical protein
LSPTPISHSFSRIQRGIQDGREDGQREKVAHAGSASGAGEAAKGLGESLCSTRWTAVQFPRRCAALSGYPSSIQASASLSCRETFAASDWTDSAGPSVAVISGGRIDGWPRSLDLP